MENLLVSRESGSLGGEILAKKLIELKGHPHETAAPFGNSTKFPRYLNVRNSIGISSLRQSSDGNFYKGRDRKQTDGKIV